MPEQSAFRNIIRVVKPYKGCKLLSFFNVNGVEDPVSRINAKSMCVVRDTASGIFMTRVEGDAIDASHATARAVVMA